jgi:hypothetical protein
MSFAANAVAALRINYAVLGELITVAGETVKAFFESGYAESFDVAGTAPTVRCIAADVPTVEVGDAVVRDGTSYTVRNVIPLAPDELELRLVLEAD